MAPNCTNCGNSNVVRRGRIVLVTQGPVFTNDSFCCVIKASTKTKVKTEKLELCVTDQAAV